MILCAAAGAADQIQSNAPAAFSRLAWTHFPKNRKKKFQFCFVAEVIMITDKRALARFGFILDMKVENNPESFYIFGYNSESFLYFWLPTGTYHQHHLMNLEFLFFPSKSCKFEPIFSLKILCIGENHILQVKNLAKFSPSPPPPKTKITAYTSDPYTQNIL